MANDKPLYLQASEFIKERIMGCSFVGVTNDGELLVAFDHDDPDLIGAAAKLIRESIEEIEKVTVVEKLDVRRAKEMIDDLNQMLAEDKPASPLINIGKF